MLRKVHIAHHVLNGYRSDAELISLNMVVGSKLNNNKTHVRLILME